MIFMTRKEIGDKHVYASPLILCAKAPFVQFDWKLIGNSGTRKTRKTESLATKKETIG